MLDYPDNSSSPHYEQLHSDWNNRNPAFGNSDLLQSYRIPYHQKYNNPNALNGKQDARNFYTGLAAVKQHDKWGFINTKGILVIPCEYDIVFDFRERVSVVFKIVTGGYWMHRLNLVKNWISQYVMVLKMGKQVLIKTAVRVQWTWQEI